MSPDVTRTEMSERLPVPRDRSILREDWSVEFDHRVEVIRDFSIYRFAVDAQRGAARNGKTRVSVQNLGVSREVWSFTSAMDDIEPTIRNRHFKIAAAISDLELAVHHVGPHVCILDSLNRRFAIIRIKPGYSGASRNG